MTNIPGRSVVYRVCALALSPFWRLGNAIFVSRDPAMLSSAAASTSGVPDPSAGSLRARG
jgi:hypothetical protein